MMTPSAMGLVAAFALVTNALMIPSTMSLPEVDIKAVAVDDIHSRLLTIPCPGCSIPDEHGNKITTVDNSIVLRLDVSEDGNGFEVNGVTVFPWSSRNKRFIMVSQVSSDIPMDMITTFSEKMTTEPRPAFYTLDSRSIPAADGSDAQIIELDFQINGLGDEVITVDRVHARLLKGDSKEAGSPGLVIHDVALVSSGGNAVSSSDVVHDAIDANREVLCVGSDSILCKLRSMIASVTSTTKPSTMRKPGCHGAKRPHVGGAISGINIKGGPNKFWNHRPEGGPLDNPTETSAEIHQGGARHRGHRGGRQGRHGHHGRRHALHKIMMVMRRVVSGFVIPVLIGVAAGMTASVLGMVVGSCLAWLWIKIIRGGRKGNASALLVVAQREVEIDADEKKRLIINEADVTDDEPLPIYVESEKQ